MNLRSHILGRKSRAWGGRREPGTWLPPVGSTETQADHQADRYGFTHQEMLDNVNLIHMNGRVYDPTLGRFLSVDPIFEFPTNTQSLNPYSYVLNNPLSLTDPTGYVACNTGQTSCPDSSGGGTKYASYTPTGSHIAIITTATRQADGSYAVTSNSPQMAQAISKMFGGNGQQNSQQSATSAQQQPADAVSIGGPAQTGKQSAFQVQKVFKHYTANDNLTNTPSPFDKKSLGVLQHYLSSPIGKLIAAYAIAHKAQIAIAEMPMNSKYRPDFSTENDTITYSLNWRGFLAELSPATAVQFKDLVGNNLLSDLFAHEIAHTRIGSMALGKPYYRGPDTLQEEFNAIRYGENPYRQFIHVPLRRSYGGYRIPAPILINPGGANP